MLYQEYKPEVLEKLQKVELEMLRDFAELCEKNNIDYFGVGGTAIGAVRHKGFIPWDDDIDIGFTRKNYEKFISVAKEQYTDKYKLINAETEKNYPLMTSRWIKKGTKFVEEGLRGVDVELGIFLDIYCFDAIADDDKKMRRQGWTAWFWGKLLVLRQVKKPILYFSGFKAGLVRFVCKIVHYMMKIFRISPKFLYKKAKKAAMRYSDEETKRIAYFFDPTPFTSIIDIENVEPTVMYEYSGMNIRMPHKIDAYLSVRYGDYMQLPPEDKRHNHPPYILDFGTENDV